MKKFCKFICMFMAAIFGLTGCGIKAQTEPQGTGQAAVQAQTSEPPQSQTEESVVTTEPNTERTPQMDTSEIMEVTELSKQFQKGMKQFSYKIFEQLENGENVVISPYSMAVAISMLNNGADGQTKKEIEKMLGITNLEEWNACMKYYMSQNKEESAKLLTANSLWLSDNLTL